MLDLRSMTSPEERKAAWMRNTTAEDRGTSASTIAGHMTNDFRGLDIKEWHAPFDWDDFSRCYKLLQGIPEWRPRMHEMRKHREWYPWADRGEEITAAYEDDDECVSLDDLIGADRIRVDE